MSTKGTHNIVKTILIFFLAVTLVMPHTTWAVSDKTDDDVVLGEGNLSKEKDLFNLTIKQEVLGLDDPSEIAFIFVIEFKKGEDYLTYAKKPYIIFENEEDKVGEEKVTDEDGKVTLKGTQRITIPKLAKEDKVKVTADVNDEDVEYTVVVESKFNDADSKKGNEAEEVIGGNDIITFTNEYVAVDEEGTPEVGDALDPFADPAPEPTPEPTPTTMPTPTAIVTQVASLPSHDQGLAKIKTGWVVEGAHTYYLNSKGKKLTGWQKIGNYQFYFSKVSGVKNGSMLTGWQVISKKTYYFEANGNNGYRGSMKTGWATAGKSNFYFDKDGELQAGGWRKLGKYWFYLEPAGAHGVKGRAAAGWKNIGGKTYYFKNAGAPGTKGRMFYGLKKINNNIFYFGGKEDGAVKTGWHTIKKKRYHFRLTGAAGEKGAAYVGWANLSGKVYCFSSSTATKERGQMLTGWQQIGNQRYLLTSAGQPRLGWQKINKKWYYFTAKGNLGTLGRLHVGWSTIGGKTYYFKNSGGHGVRGRMFSGLRSIGKGKYYFGKSEDGSMKTGFHTIGKYKLYFEPSGKANGAKGKMAEGWKTIDGSKYYFYYKNGRMATNVTISGIYIGKDGKAVELAKPVVVGGSGQKTIKSFLQNAMKPVGSTLYIWGGGHDAWQKGGDGVRAGVNPNWAKFYKSKGSSYDYNSYRFQHGNGLDCSGFVGWTAYNAIEKKSNVMSTGSATTSTSTGMPAKYAANGWGTVSTGTSAAKFTPGDVVSRSGHVWIVLGQCSDGSVVVIHSTPQAGVQIAGSPTLSGDANSEAIKLAQTYMKRYYPNVVNKFKLSSIVGLSYMKPINRFRWDVSGKQLMKDPEGYLKKTPKAILKDIFNE